MNAPAPGSRAGSPFAGISVGIIMHCDTLIRIPGDVGNALSFPFPVHYRLVPELEVAEVKSLSARRHAGAVVAAGRELEALGVTAITCGCGFMSLFQPMLAEAVHVPVFASSLVQVPFVSTLVGRRPIGILSADASRLTEEHLQAAGWSSSDYDVRIVGLSEDPDFLAIIDAGLDETERFRRVEASMVRAAASLQVAHPELGAFVFECTNMPPYAAAVQRATGLPVFDIVTLTQSVQLATSRRPYA